MKKIQCLLERQGGTQVTIGETDYHFKPDEVGAHVCNVDDEDVEAFLNVPEAYAEYDGESETVVTKNTEPKAAKAPKQPKAAKAEKS